MPSINVEVLTEKHVEDYTKRSAIASNSGGKNWKWVTNR